MKINVSTYRGEGFLTTDRAESNYGVPILVIPAKNDLSYAEQVFKQGELACEPLAESAASDLEEIARWNEQVEAASNALKEMLEANRPALTEDEAEASIRRMMGIK